MKEKLQKILNKAFPGSKILDYQEPLKNYGTHRIYILQYEYLGITKKVVLKVLSPNKRKIINPLRYNIKSEAALLEKASKTINVPKLIYFEDSKEILKFAFILIEYIEGYSLESIPYPNRGAFLKNIIKEIANLHSLEAKQFNFLTSSYFGKSIIKELKRIIKVNNLIASREELTFAEEVIKYLNKRIPKTQDIALLHGDLEPGHFIIDKENKYYIIDWDAAAIGDKSWDIFWMMRGNPERLYGVTSEELITLYESSSGHKLLNKDFYELCALLMGYLYWIFIIQKEPNHPYIEAGKKFLPLLKNKIKEKLK